MKEHVLVYRNIKEILIEDVDQNVYKITIVRKIKLALEINVSILVLELVEKMPNVP